MRQITNPPAKGEKMSVQSMRCPRCNSTHKTQYRRFSKTAKESGALWAILQAAGDMGRDMLSSMPNSDYEQPNAYICDNCGQTMMECPNCHTPILLEDNPRNLTIKTCPKCFKRVHYGSYHEMGGG